MVIEFVLSRFRKPSRSYLSHSRFCFSIMTHNTKNESRVETQNPTKKPKLDKDTNEDQATSTSSITQTSKISKAMNEVFGSLELEKTNAVEEVGKKLHLRNHVNPLSTSNSAPVDAPKWEDVYSNPNLPLFVDIGCAAGRFGIAAALSDRFKGHNHLGLEIRSPLVSRALVWAKAKNLGNAHFIACSANTSIANFLSTYPGPIAWVAVQFPDPHFKKKHHKRRVVQPELLEALSQYMPEDSILFLQSDVEETSSQMRDRAKKCKYFTQFGDYSERSSDLDIDVNCNGTDKELWTGDGKCAKEGAADYGEWLQGPNPVGIPTEREVQNTALDLPIYRSMFKRNSIPFEK